LSSFDLLIVREVATTRQPRSSRLAPVELKDDDPPLLRLKKGRFNAALNEAKARFDKARALQRQLDVYNEAQANFEKQVRDGLATQADLERLRYNKVSLEIDLVNLKSVHDEDK